MWTRMRPSSSNGQTCATSSARDPPLIGGRARTQRRAGERQPAPDDIADVDLGGSAEVARQQHHPAIFPQQGKLALRIGTGLAIENDIDAMALRSAAALQRPIRGPVVDRRVGAGLQADAAFLLGAGVASTRASRSVRAIWIAAMPTPLVPPCTSRVSPWARRPSQIMLFQTVKNASGKAAASTKPTPFGTGMHCTAGTQQNSA